MDDLRPTNDLTCWLCTWICWWRYDSALSRAQNSERLIHHFVDGRLFVARTGYDVLVVSGNVAAQHRRGFFGLWIIKKHTHLKWLQMWNICKCGEITWNILAPYGVRHALSRLSLPVDTNHFPQVANRNESTQLSCKWSWYFSGLVACRTSTCEFSMPTANQSPKI